MPSATAVLLRTQSDERLVALARAGHERAFEAIVERYRRPLLRACRRVLPEARAEDAVQAALMAAWAGLERGDEVEELRPWLYRIARNTALNQLRVAGYDYGELHDLLDGGPAPEEVLERREVARRTLTGLAALPERQREALLAVAVQGRGQEEVAAALGISEPAVRQLIHRARTRLRAAATAVTPLPAAAWLAEAGSRADVVAGGGATAAAAKVGALLALAGGGAAAVPTVVDHFDHGGVRAVAPKPAPAIVADAARVPAAAAPPPTPARLIRVADARPQGARSRASGHDAAGPSGGHADRRGPSGGGDRTRSSGGDDRAGSSGGAERTGSPGGDDGPSPEPTGSPGGDDQRSASRSASSGGSGDTSVSSGGDDRTGGTTGGDDLVTSSGAAPTSGSADEIDHSSGD